MYCTPAEVAQEAQDLVYVDSSDPNIAKRRGITEEVVQRMIDEEAAFINGKISNLYTVPVVQTTSPTAFSILKVINIHLVLARVATIVRIQINAGSKYISDSQQIRNNAIKKVEEIILGNLQLVDAIKQRVIVSSNASLEENTARGRFTLNRDCDNW